MKGEEFGTTQVIYSLGFCLDDRAIGIWLLARADIFVYRVQTGIGDNLVTLYAYRGLLS
jgi:hypothetical protein